MIAFDASGIEKLMAKHDLSRESFAKRIGTTRASVTLWLLGDQQPNMATLVKICNTFKVAPSFFFCKLPTTVGDKV